MEPSGRRVAIIMANWGTARPRIDPILSRLKMWISVLSGVVGISTGDWHTVYFKSDGSVWATGYNQYGQLGDGTTTSRSNPAQVENVDGSLLVEWSAYPRDMLTMYI